MLKARGILGFIVFAAVFLSGCVYIAYDPWATKRALAKAHRPYYGTGVVGRVHMIDARYGLPYVDIQFGQTQPPSIYTPLIIVSSNTIVGRIKMTGDGDTLPPYWGGANVVEGEAPTGFLALGIIYESHYKLPHKPRVKLPNQPLQPTAVRPAGSGG